MFDSSSDRGYNWGCIIFFLILFWVFLGGGGLGMFGGRNGFAGNGFAGNNEQTSLDNMRVLADLQCQQAKNAAVMTGQLDTAFRQVINNDNINTARLLDGQKDIYIKQLEQKNNELFVTSENEKTRNQALMLKADTDAKLAAIECHMLKQPPIYPHVCVPCASNPCGPCGGGYV